MKNKTRSMTAWSKDRDSSHLPVAPCFRCHRGHGYLPARHCARQPWAVALIAIIRGTAGPTLSTILRIRESEQLNETSEMPIQAEHGRARDIAEHEHQMHMEKELKVPGAKKWS